VPHEQPWNNSKAPRANNLDFLRLFFASLVIWSHSYPLLRGEANASEPVSRLTRGQTTGGGLAVAFFFIISGFLITQSWFSSRGVGNFARKRVLRLYPGFIVVSAFCAYVAAPLGGAPWGELLHAFSLPRFLMNQALLYLPAVGGAFARHPMPYVLNGSAWTIKYEFWCYGIVAVFGLLGLLKRRALVLAAFALSLAVYALQTNHVISGPLPFENGRTWYLFGDFSLYGRFVPLFLAGSVFFLFREVIPFSPRLAAFCAAGLAAGTVLGQLNPLLPVLGTYLVFFAGFAPFAGERLRDFGRRGDLSYGVYLYAFPVQQLLIHYLPGRLTPPTLFLAALPPTFALAALSWRFVESPFLRRKTSQFRPGASPPAMPASSGGGPAITLPER